MKEQNCDHRWPAMFIVATAGMAEDSWTPIINGVIDLDEEIQKDDLDFLKVDTSSQQSATQRAGRAGRTRDGLVLRLGKAPHADADEWVLPYSEALQTTLVAQQLQYPGPIPGVAESRRRSLLADLVNLGLCGRREGSPFHAMTALGHAALEGSLDIRLNVLVYAGHLLGIGQHALIAAAFIEQRIDLFVDLMPSVEPRGGLTVEQRLLGRAEGDVHTGVWWFLSWLDGGRQLRDGPRRCLKTACFKRMEAHLRRMRAPYIEARTLMQVPGWADALTIVLAFAYQKHLGCQQGQKYVTGHVCSDPERQRLGMEDLQFCVAISNRSVCCREGQAEVQAEEQDEVEPASRVAEGSTWIVYAGTGRRGLQANSSYVKNVVVVPAHIAGWFTSLPVSWALPDGARCSPQRFLDCMIRLLNSPQGSPGLQRLQNSWCGHASEPGPEGGVVEAPDEALPGDQSADKEEEEDAAPDFRRARHPSAEFRSMMGEVRVLLQAKEFEDASDFVQALHELRSRIPPLGDELERFARNVTLDETPPTPSIIVEMRRHLVDLLTLMLWHRNIPRLRRKVRQFAHRCSAKVQKELFPRSPEARAPRPASTEAHALLSPVRQAELMSQCLANMEQGEPTADLAQRVDRTRASEGDGQKARRKCRKLMRTIYQRIDWATGAISWVVFQDLRMEVTRGGVRGEREVEQQCTFISKDACFSLDLYEISGQTLTAAEACQEWLRQGDSKQRCKERLAACRPSGGLRQVPPDEEASIRQRLREAIGG